MNARELLKEALDRLSEVAMLYQNKGDIDLIKRIDAYLAAPSESAMEIAYQIKMLWVDDYGGERHDIFCPACWKKYQADAASLIEGLQRRVPRKMLEEVFGLAYSKGEDYASLYGFDAIAAKHGVVIEE